jgi:hypothetical protein
MRISSSSLNDSIVETLTDTADPFDRNRHNGIEITLSGPWASRFTYLLTGILSIWIFVYVSGLYPYLGYITHTNSYSGIFMKRDSGLGTFKVPRAYLFKGQTIFIDYKVQVEGEGSVRIALEGGPSYKLAFWPRTHFDVKGSSKGRLYYVVPENGFYNVEANAFQWKGKYHISYTLNWGATWSADLNAFPKTDVPAQQMPIQEQYGPFPKLKPSLAP